MLRTVEPHDLERLCCDNNKDLLTLSQATGVSVPELREFAAGRLALSACDRLLIFATVLDYNDERIRAWLHGYVVSRRSFGEEVDPLKVMPDPPDAIREAKSLQAIDILFEEAREEIEQLNRRRSAALVTGERANG